MGEGSVKTFEDVYEVQREHYKPYVGMLPGMHNMTSRFWAAAPDWELEGPVTFFPLNPSDLPTVTSPVANSIIWQQDWDQKQFMGWEGATWKVGFVGIRFRNWPGFRAWGSGTIVFSDCYFNEVFGDVLYGGGPATHGYFPPQTIFTNCSFDAIHNWVRNYGQGMEPKKGGSGADYVKGETPGSYSDLWLFLRNSVRHATGSPHVSSVASSELRSAWMAHNVIYNCAIGLSNQGWNPGLACANNIFLLPPNGLTAIYARCQQVWDISGGSTWINWGGAPALYDSNYIGVGVPNWRVLWVGAPNEGVLDSHIVTKNLVEYGLNSSYCVGVGGGGDVLPLKKYFKDGVPEFFSDATNTVREGALGPLEPDIDLAHLIEFVHSRPGGTEVGPKQRVGPVFDGDPIDPDPGLPPGPDPTIEQVLAELRKLQRDVDKIPKKTLRMLRQCLQNLP